MKNIDFITLPIIIVVVSKKIYRICRLGLLSNDENLISTIIRRAMLTTIGYVKRPVEHLII